MKIQLFKKGFSGSAIGGWTNKIIAGLVLIAVAAVVIPLIADSGDTLNATGLPLAGLFASDSVLPLVIMAGLAVAAVGAYMKFGKR